MLARAINNQQLLDLVAMAGPRAYAILDNNGGFIWENARCAQQVGCDDLSVSLSQGSLRQSSIRNENGQVFAQLIHLPEELDESHAKHTNPARPQSQEDLFSMLNDLMSDLLSYDKKVEPLAHHVTDVVTQLTEELLRNADEALFRAKSMAKGEIVCFDQSMSEETKCRRQLESDLRDAIDTRQFTLHFQPQVNTKNGEVKSVEALIRWLHPTRGYIAPNDFIGVAEETGLIHEIGAWVIEEAVSHLARWQHTGLKDIRVAVNIAASRFTVDNFAQNLISLMSNKGVHTSLLEIEVTESIVMNDIQVVISTLELLRSEGVKVAVDDFGTGYSSLSYLQDLPLDVLKIDRSFIRHLDKRTIEKSVTNTVMLLASDLNLKTVAEGVETRDQFNLVRWLGCSTVQVLLLRRTLFG